MTVKRNNERHIRERQLEIDKDRESERADRETERELWERVGQR